MSWDSHVDLVISKTCSGIYALRRMVSQCELETLRTIYYALIHSHISYGISIYDIKLKKFRQYPNPTETSNNNNI